MAVGLPDNPSGGPSIRRYPIGMVLRRMFAERPLNIARLPSFRAEHFPDSGPYPWLDERDASERIDRKLSAGELTPEEASQCRYWTENGYIILKRLIDAPVLEDVWEAYERAVRAGKIQLLPEPAGDGDPYPGRFLNPHKKAPRFCRILKHPGLLHWLRILMEREPKTLQTIASHKGSQ